MKQLLMEIREMGSDMEGLGTSHLAVAIQAIASMSLGFLTPNQLMKLFH
jgi:hypothetical protein